MEIGKLPNEVLERIVLGNTGKIREDVLVHAGIGQDCAVLDFGEYACALSVDPITGATKNIGELAIHVSCNDMAASGAEPIGILLTLLIPPFVTEEEIEEIMKDADRAAKDTNIEIVGGHTEVTEAVNKIIMISTIVGKEDKKKFLNKGKVKAGDKLILTKHIGIEGTYIIANDLYDKLKDNVDEKLIDDAKNMSREVSVLKDGRIGNKYNAKYMHDITEGGILGAVWEAAKANKVGMKIEKEKIKIKEATVAISNFLKLDPYKLISSGSMLIIANPEDSEIIIEKLEEEGIDGNIIGEVTEELDILFEEDSKASEIIPPRSDEIYKVI